MVFTGCVCVSAVINPDLHVQDMIGGPSPGNDNVKLIITPFDPLESPVLHVPKSRGNGEKLLIKTKVPR